MQSDVCPKTLSFLLEWKFSFITNQFSFNEQFDQTTLQFCMMIYDAKEHYQKNYKIFQRLF